MFKSVINNKLDNSMVACLALEAIMKDQVEHNRSRSNGNAYQLRREEPESARLCVVVGLCLSGSVRVDHGYSILVVCLAGASATMNVKADA